ncbi:hypothetical protein NE237_008037 [Protea cynaroides]|uniref:Uncharacterized protein n=1 Tax=Protea cynaroides TaxID=273540 RepID=A0A9Q0QWR6_9MAGN|nr:hypothetical protein NE237_008037 [Protea cynaroides]
MASTPILSRHFATTGTPTLQFSTNFSSNLTPTRFPLKPTSRNIRPITKLFVSSPTNKPTLKTPPKPTEETIFFDGGAHYGDLLANLLLGFTLLWSNGPRPE